jgi:hypothetical protein
VHSIFGPQQKQSSNSKTLGTLDTSQHARTKLELCVSAKWSSTSVQNCLAWRSGTRLVLPSTVRFTHRPHLMATDLMMGRMLGRMMGRLTVQVQAQVQAQVTSVHAVHVVTSVILDPSALFVFRNASVVLNAHVIPRAVPTANVIPNAIAV